VGRKPIGKKAMTPAQRQRRRRTRVRRALIAAGAGLDKAERRKRRLAKLGKQIIPAPPGITYWREITVTTLEGERQVWAPITQPAPGVALRELTNIEIASLIEVLEREQDRRAGREVDPLQRTALNAMLASRPPGYRSKLEMFAREPRAGWDIYGAEVCVALGLMG
jgi:hypothetical protein